MSPTRGAGASRQGDRRSHCCGQRIHDGGRLADARVEGRIDPEDDPMAVHAPERPVPRQHPPNDLQSPRFERLTSERGRERAEPLEGEPA